MIIVKNKDNKRLQALKVLGIWIIVLAFLMGAAYVLNSNKKEENETIINSVDEIEKNDKQDGLSYYEKLDKLITNNYDFVYLINKNGEKVKFEGTKEDLIVTGYKQTEDEIIKYKIIGQKTYQVGIDKDKEITNLYDDIDASLLELNYVIGILRQIAEKDVIVTEEENKTIYDYNLNQDEEELEITVKENEESIESISIRRRNEAYELLYKEK